MNKDEAEKMLQGKDNRPLNSDKFKKFAGFIEKHNIVPIRELDPNIVCMCTLVSEWNPENNDFWSLDDNKSAPREVVCFGCGQPLVMSNWLWNKYQEMETKPKVGCAACVGQLMQEEK